MATIEERVSALESTTGHLATKADLAAQEARLEARLGALEARFEAGLGALEARIMRWLVTTIIASVAATAAVSIAISRLIG